MELAGWQSAQTPDSASGSFLDARFHAGKIRVLSYTQHQEHWRFTLKSAEIEHSIEFRGNESTSSMFGRFSPDGNRVLTASNTQGILIHNERLQSPRHDADSLHPSAYRAAAPSSNGQRIFTSEYQPASRSAVTYWGNGPGIRLGTVDGSIHSMVASLSGKYLATGSDDGTITLWDLSTEQKIQSFKGHDTSVRSLSLSADGERLATVSADGSVRWWNPLSARLLAHIPCRYHPSNRAELNPAGNALLVTSAIAGTVELWTPAGRVHQEQMLRHGPVGFAPNGFAPGVQSFFVRSDFGAIQYFRNAVIIRP